MAVIHLGTLRGIDLVREIILLYTLEKKMNKTKCAFDAYLHAHRFAKLGVFCKIVQKRLMIKVKYIQCICQLFK
jgi:hypothetical protein